MGSAGEATEAAHHGVRGLPTLDSILQDLRYTLRTLRRDAAFATFAILIVGLGVGASSTVFSIVNAILIRPLPFRDPDRLVWIVNHEENSDLSGQTTQVGHFLDLREQNQSFSDLAAYFAFYGVGDNKLTGQGEPERLSGVPVSANFFQLLGVQPRLGRLFTPEECKWNGPKVVLLGHGLWVRRFASDPGIVGRALTLNDEPVTVVGVLPESFHFASVFAPGSHIDLYFPFPLTAETNRWGNTLAIIGRLKPGATLPRARAEVAILSRHLTEAHERDRNDFAARLSFLREHVSGRLRPALVVLACAVGVVILIVCANLSNLLLARTATRQKEIAIRVALGAGRARLIRQMLTESVVLSCCGAVLGIVLAVAGTPALAHMDGISIPLLEDVRIDMGVLGFTLSMAVLTGLIFGLVPALQVRASAVHDALKDTSRGSTEAKGRTWIRSGLVISEVAFACVLLVGAGLLIRSFLRVLDVNLGFRPERAAAVRVDPSQQHSTQAQQNAYFDEVLRLARDIPGIGAAGLTDALPLGRNRSWGSPVKGVDYAKGQYPDAFVRIVSDSYIKAMGIPVIAGRDITARDTPSTELVILINQTMARNLFPGGNAIGQIIRSDKDRRVVGIVGDVRHLALEQGAGNEMYIPIRQTGDFASVDLVLRTTLPPSELASAVRGALKSIAPNLPRNDFRTLQQLVDKAVSPRRFVVMLLGGFALFALILASLGIYGVISYSVNQRTQETGIRMALGASAGDLQARIMMQTLGLAVIGMLLGGAASWALARALSGLLFGVAPGDPVTFLGMLAALTVVAALAGYAN
ncbi:MAG: multidrug ABC transporter substrate-binding protein [Acidobacteria bacterium]|nr:MAG: multidrug ABC transporter substrate-binding protein [Acidobacteriota bacterium]